MSSETTSSLPSSKELRYAISILAYILDTLNVKYGLIGGAAVALSAREYGLVTRQTEDIDLIIQPVAGVSAMAISSQLNTDPQFSRWIRAGELYGTPRPRILVMRGNKEILVDIEIFDHTAWPNRRDYYDLDLASNARVVMTVEGRSTCFLNASWLLRQKIRSCPGRGSDSKRMSDMTDIETLCEVLIGTGQTLEITVSEEVTDLKTVYEAANEERKSKIRQVVNCPLAFSPTASSGNAINSASASDSNDWIWSEECQKYYRYDEANEVVWS